MWYKCQMRLSVKVFCLSFLAVALLAGSATSFASQSTTVGRGTKRCVPGPGADCRGVVERWTVEYHGDLRKAKFTGAVLHGADFRGADLRGADFRGAKLRYADFRGANLLGVRFDAVKQMRKNTKQAGCYPNCQGADLQGANLTGADLSGAHLNFANLSGSDLTDANLINAQLLYAIVTNANLDNANLTNANLTGALWYNATCPDGTITNTGC